MLGAGVYFEHGTNGKYCQQFRLLCHRVSVPPHLMVLMFIFINISSNSLPTFPACCLQQVGQLWYIEPMVPSAPTWHRSKQTWGQRGLCSPSPCTGTHFPHCGAFQSQTCGAAACSGLHFFMSHKMCLRAWAQQVLTAPGWFCIFEGGRERANIWLTEKQKVKKHIHFIF